MGKVLVYALRGERGAVVLGGFVANPPDALVQPHRIPLRLPQLVEAARGAHAPRAGTARWFVIFARPATTPPTRKTHQRASHALPMLDFWEVADPNCGLNSLILLVGAPGFEPATPSRPDWYANRATSRSGLKNEADARRYGGNAKGTHPVKTGGPGPKRLGGPAQPLEEIRERKRVASSKLTHYSKPSLTAEIAQLPPWPSFSHQ
jgi:hypothetical protein